MKFKYEFLCGFSGYDVFAVDQHGARMQIGYSLPHFDAAVRMAIGHAGQPIVVHADMIG